MKIVEIKDTFCECFQLKIARILITSFSKEWALETAKVTAGFGVSIIMSPSQAAIERYITPENTPDNRPGYIIQIQHTDEKELEKQLIARLGQCVLTAPSANVFDAMIEQFKEGKYNIGRKLAYFGDGFEYKDNRFNRKVWVVPRMDEDFVIEENIWFTTGYDSNFTLFADSRENAIRAAENAISAIRSVEGVITIGVNGIIATASKKGSKKYKFLRASVQEKVYPSLKSKIANSDVPENAKAAYEIVPIGLSFELVKEAFRRGVLAAKESKGVLAITASN
ncbi:MAG: formylmethanofuran--tetrahydromethanopterin N-formyltransferase, partial [Candidatus Heimdallarchaeaceae archaeon]